MAKFVKLSKKQITSILSERLKWDKEYCIFDESGNLQQGFSSLLNLNSLEKIVKNFSELNPALFSTFNIRNLVEKVIVTILNELVVEDQAELEAEKKLKLLSMTKIAVFSHGSSAKNTMPKLVKK